MKKRLSAPVLAVLAAGALAVPGTAAAVPGRAGPVPGGAASAGVAPVVSVRIAVHFDVTAGQLPENVALAPDGTALVTLAAARQVAAVTRAGSVRTLATLPAPADGGVHTPVLGFPLTTGIARSGDGTLYLLYATGTADLTGVWRVRPGDRPRRIAALPAEGLPNGLALDERRGTLYLTDSVLGRIFTVPVSGGTPTTWSADPTLASTGFLGANGLKLHDGAVWVSNLDQGTLLRFPLERGRAGTVEVRAAGLVGVDDFAFTGRGAEVIAALNGPNTVVRIRPGGTVTPLLTAADGLQNPTSVAVRGTTLYVLNAAYLTGTDPNLLLARVPGRH